MSTQNLPLIEKHPSKDDLDRVPHPSHRHAAPSAPWPWVDLEDGVSFFLFFFGKHVFQPSYEFTAIDSKQLECVASPIPEFCDHSPGRCNSCWRGYPQSRFPNWTERQVIKAKIYDAIHNYAKNRPCTCYRVDVNDSGFFTNVKEMVAEFGDEDTLWDQIIHEQVSCSHFYIYVDSMKSSFFQRPRDIRLRALFIEDLSGPVLQMLGTKYLYSTSLFIPLLIARRTQV